nr:nicotinate-nucleotide adenylyltransferase [uncultured Lachnoclostridium sp.]
MDQKNRVGIMGGTFNPIHLGHLMTGECAYEQFELDKVLFMPSKTPPHKTIQEHISADDRASMVKLAIAGNPHFAFSGMELERSGVTYTVDTLRELHQIHPYCEYYFIIGADSLFDFSKWREPEAILKLATVLVASRYGIAKDKLKEQAATLQQEYGGTIQIVDMPTIEFSSSEIRARKKEGKNVRYYVDEKVRIYIEEHELYRG